MHRVEFSMQWGDLIERLITENGGIASLSSLYRSAHKYKKLPTGIGKKLYEVFCIGKLRGAGL